jgi:hypothetical protein
MGATEYFSENYRQARERFLKSVRDSGRTVTSFENPAGQGALGEALNTDVALYGASSARNLLVLVSATHGVEGFCGSAIQTGLIHEGRLEAPDADTATLVIHAINPYGFSWRRRANEDNIDLNRNSVDHAHPPASHVDYALLHAHLVPEIWQEDGSGAADLALAQFVRERGERALQAAVSLGQYDHPDGLFFGGHELAWSTRTFHDIVRRYGKGKQRVAFIDFHTGLGPSGYGEPIYTEVDREGLARARAWYGPEVTSVHQGDSSSAQVQGSLINGARWVLPHAELTPLALEFGTLPGPEVMRAMRAELWLHLHGDSTSDLGRRIQNQMQDSFYVDTDVWKCAVLERGREIVAKALTGLSNPPT